MLRRITWSSVISPGFSPARLNEIIAPARRNNERSHISGMLVFNGSQFLAIHEGHVADLDALWCRLLGDTRHAGVFRIGDEACGRRMFPDWMMGYTCDGKVGHQIDALRALATKIDREPAVVGRKKRDLASTSAQRTMSWAKALYPMMMRADSM